MLKRLHITLLLLLLGLGCLPGLDHGIWRPDEPRVVGICSEMARNLDLAVPRLNGKPFLEKPPLYYATSALFARAVGNVKSDVVYRLVSIGFSVLTLIIVYRIAYLKWGPVHGIVAAVILATSWEYFMVSRWIMVDISLVFSIVLAMYAYMRLCKSNKITDAAMLGLAIGLAFMAKGMVGPSIIGVSIILDMIIRVRDIRSAFRWHPAIIMVSMLIPVIPWMLSLYLREDLSFLKEILIVNNIGRLLGCKTAAALGHHHGTAYYLERFPRDFLPWTFIFIPAFTRSIKRFREDTFLPWFIGPFILLSLASTKRGIYLVPLYPAAAFIITEFLRTKDHIWWENITIKITWVIAFILCLLPFAGIVTGDAVPGIILGSISSIMLAVNLMKRKSMNNALSLVLVVAMGLYASTTVYFNYMKPKQDYLGFSKKALELAHGSSITILNPDETFEGVLPMLTGKTFKEEKSVSRIKEKGLFIWKDSHDSTLGKLKKMVNMDVEVILEQKIGRNMVRLAFITPRRST